MKAKRGKEGRKIRQKKRRSKYRMCWDRKWVILVVEKKKIKKNTKSKEVEKREKIEILERRQRKSSETQ